MSNRESRMRQVVVAALRGLDPVSVENPAHPGTPDVNCTAGWVELKCLDELPVRPSSVVRVKHFTPQQRVWLRRRWEANRRAWLLLRVGGVARGAYQKFGSVEVERKPRAADPVAWLLFDGYYAATHLGIDAHFAALEYSAIRVWRPNLVASELRDALVG